MLTHLILALIAFSSGFVIAGGVIALIAGLGIINRLIGVTHTGKHIRVFETCILFGGLFGNLLTVYNVSIPLGGLGLSIIGICSGMFVGGWILALAEVVNIFPIFFRRIGLVKGVSFIMITIALGKTLSSLLQFYMRW